MPSRQWRILLDITGPNRKQNIEDEDLIVGMMGTCNLDPSVRFFGIEWELVFGKCFSLSLNVKIFGQQIMNSSKDTFCSSSTSAIDLILVRHLTRHFYPRSWEGKREQTNAIFLKFIFYILSTVCENDNIFSLYSRCLRY